MSHRDEDFHPCQGWSEHSEVDHCVTRCKMISQNWSFHFLLIGMRWKIDYRSPLSLRCEGIILKPTIFFKSSQNISSLCYGFSGGTIHTRKFSLRLYANSHIPTSHIYTQSYAKNFAICHRRCAATSASLVCNPATSLKHFNVAYLTEESAIVCLSGSVCLYSHIPMEWPVSTMI